MLFLQMSLGLSSEYRIWLNLLKYHHSNPVECSLMRVEIYQGTLFFNGVLQKVMLFILLSCSLNSTANMCDLLRQNQAPNFHIRVESVARVVGGGLKIIRS